MSANAVICNNREFDSFRQFTDFYGLPYTSAQYYRKKGKTPEEILDLCRFRSSSKTTTTPKPHTKRYTCEYDGVQYTSLSEAADALGFSPSQIYELRRKNHLSPSAAIAMAMEHRMNKGGPKQGGHAKECVIDGVTYESRAAALRAYKVPAITVYSRMERDGISFEEALLMGRKASLYCPPTGSLFPSLRLVAGSAPDEPLADLATALDYYKCKIKQMQDLTSHLPVMLVNDSVYIFANQQAKGIEFISEIPEPQSMDTINLLNSAHVATKIFTVPQTGKAYLHSFQITKDETVNVKLLLQAYFTLVATREAVLKTLLSEGVGNRASAR